MATKKVDKKATKSVKNATKKRRQKSDKSTAIKMVAKRCFEEKLQGRDKKKGKKCR